MIATDYSTISSRPLGIPRGHDLPFASTAGRSSAPSSYRVPDARVGNFVFDVSLEAKKPSKDQIQDFFRADFKPTGVVIIRPNQLGDNSSYIIWRQDGD